MPTSASQSPEVAFGLACLALIGVLITALVVYLNAKSARIAEDARARDRLQHEEQQQQRQLTATEKLDELRTKLERDLAAQKQAFEAELLFRKQVFDRDLEAARTTTQDLLEARKAEVDRELAAYQARSAEALTILKSRLDEELQHRRILVALNEENWRHVHAGIRTLRDAGFAMSGAFKVLANHVHTHIAIAEDQLISESLTALRRHDEFRTALRALRGEIRPKDYDELEHFLKYLVLVFLDVGRTPEERQGKVQTMHDHEQEIGNRERRFQGLVEKFLQPYSKLPNAG